MSNYTGQFAGQGHIWKRGKTDIELFGPEKAKLIGKKISKALKGKSTGIAKNADAELLRRKRISDGMKKAHREGRANKWKRTNSFAEQMFEAFLIKKNYKKGVDFVREKRFGLFSVDFFFPEKNLAIEIDGQAHFRYEHLKQRDKVKDNFLNSKGIIVLRIIWKVLFHHAKITFNQIEKLIIQNDRIAIEKFMLDQFDKLLMMKNDKHKYTKVMKDGVAELVSCSRLQI